MAGPTTNPIVSDAPKAEGTEPNQTGPEGLGDENPKPEEPEIPEPAKLLSKDDKLNVEWAPFVTKAVDSKYLDVFNLQGEPFTCESSHFATPNKSVYSSAKNKTSLGDEAIVVDEDSGGIALGLDAEGDVGEISLKKALGVFGIDPEPKNGTLHKVVNLLEQLGFISIDTSRLGNGFWIMPNIAKDPDTDKITSVSLEIATRLGYKSNGLVSTEVSDIIAALGQDFGLDLSEAATKWAPKDFAIVLTDIINLDVAKAPELVSTVTVQLPSFKGFVLYVSQTGDDTTVALQQRTDPEAAPTKLLGDLNSFSDAPPADDALPGDSFGPIVRLWYADVNTQKNWTIALILSLPLSSTPEGQVPIYLKYDKKEGTFSGGILRGELPEESQINLPKFKEWQGLPEDILQANENTPYVDLAKALDFNAPKGLPTKLTAGKISYKQAAKTPAKPAALKIAVELGTGEADPDSEGPPAPFNWEKAKFEYEKQGTEISWLVSAEFALKEKDPTILEDGSKRPDGLLSLELSRKEKKLSLKGSAKNINFAMLSGFFQPELSDTMVDILGKIEIAELDVDYSYTSEGKAADFLFSGALNIGKLQLSMYYQYTSARGATPEGEATRTELLTTRRRSGPPPPKPIALPENKTTAWEFEAFLAATGEKETIGTVIESIIGDDPLPEFISKIDVPTAGADATKPLMHLKVAKVDETKVIFVFNVALSFLEFSFIQIATSAPKGPTGQSLPGPRPLPTRILRFSIGPLPFIKKIPVIEELPQPYQLLTFCYVGGRELTTDEVDLLNTDYIADSKIYYKKVTQNQKAGLLLGNHFIVVNNDECILDHVFPAKATPKKQNNLQHSQVRALTDSQSSEPVEQTSPPTKGALTKRSKFLTIKGISVQYKDKTLWLFLDATLKLGPVELSLIGCGIGFKLSNVNLNDFSTFSMDDLDFKLNGVSMYFDQPPVLIAGVFIHEVTATMNSYRGGIAVGFKPYEFVAVGEYAEITDGAAKYKSIFIYAKLDGPLIDLEIAIIKGVRLGFGYNSFVRSPSVNELADFPFINDVGIGGAGNNPMAILDSMRGGDNPWVQPKQESFWFAAGLSIAAFDIITATAVALLQFSDEGVVVNIFADVIAQMPPEVKSPEMCILYVELLLNAELNFIHDYFFVQAALAPTSFLLVPQCHLYGGFAMGTWFGRSDYAGDWVFSVGGYHRQFDVPAHYPRPDRLGIKFNIGDNMSITGEGYFAITPKAVMGGAMIYIQLHVGPVSAHLNAGFDALVQFHPLHYIVDVYVEVGVSCRIHLLFVSFDLSIDIGADLHIEGPSFGGVAHVDFWFFGFDVYFGEQPSPPPPLHLAAFYDIVAKAGPPEERVDTKSDNVESETVVQLKFTLEEGACPMPVKDAEKGAGPENAGVGSVWRVRGGSFRFRVASVFAITTASIATAESIVLNATDPVGAKALEQKVDNAKDAVAISSIPMQVTPGGFATPLSITISDQDPGQDEKYPSGWKPKFVVDTVPTALWGDPNNPPNALDSKNGTVPLQMAVSITAPDPILAVSKIPPVDATEINRQLVKKSALDPSETQSGLQAATLDKTPKLWPDMQTAWETAAKDNTEMAKNLADGFMKALGWDNPAPEVVQTAIGTVKKPWVLDSSFPTRLVSGTGGQVDGVEDGLANMYLALPRVIAV